METKYEKMSKHLRSFDDRSYKIMKEADSQSINEFFKNWADACLEEIQNLTIDDDVQEEGYTNTICVFSIRYDCPIPGLYNTVQEALHAKLEEFFLKQHEDLNTLGLEDVASAIGSIYSEFPNSKKIRRDFVTRLLELCKKELEDLPES